MFQKGFEHKGAAAYEPGVYLENPMKCHAEHKIDR